eukprot:3254865-Rhodomonas_salina.1
MGGTDGAYGVGVWEQEILQAGTDSGCEILLAGTDGGYEILLAGTDGGYEILLAGTDGGYGGKRYQGACWLVLTVGMREQENAMHE